MLLLLVAAAGMLEEVSKISIVSVAGREHQIHEIPEGSSQKRQTLVRTPQYAFSRARGFCQENFEKAGLFGTVGWRFLRFACVPRRKGA